MLHLSRLNNAFYFLLIVLGASGFLASAQAQTATDELTTFTGLKTDIPIGRVGDVELSINVALPEEQGDAPLPVLVFVHGGGLIDGDKDQFNDQVQQMAGSMGIASASLMYRLAPEYRFPAAIEDVQAGIRFLKANAEVLNLDPDRIIVFGVSSGGYLATMVGVIGNSQGFSDNGIYPDYDSSVRAVISQAGHIADFTLPKYQNYPTVDRFLDETIEDRQTALAAISPVTYLDENDPPFFLYHGSADERVPVDMTREFVQALEAIEHPHVYREIEGGGHSLSATRPLEASKVFGETFGFFRQYAYDE